MSGDESSNIFGNKEKISLKKYVRAFLWAFLPALFVFAQTTDIHGRPEYSERSGDFDAPQ